MASTPTGDDAVVHNEDEHRYEVFVDGELAGFTEYRSTPAAMVFVHTEIGDAHEGKGLGGRLARAALDDVRAKGRKVVAQCPFIRGWIVRHPDYEDLLA